MARMTRVSPPELERVFPGPQASSSVTSAPDCSNCNAVHPPNAPAPTTTTRNFGAAKRLGASRRATMGTAATHPTNVRRETFTRSEIHSRSDSKGAGLIREEPDARACAALLIEPQKRRLVRGIVDEHGRVPVLEQHADAHIDDVIRRQLRIERECALRERSADRSLERQQ